MIPHLTAGAVCGDLYSLYLCLATTLNLVH